MEFYFYLNYCVDDMRHAYDSNLHKCSSCIHWKFDSKLPDVEANVMISLCEINQCGHDRKEAKEWMRGSDGCSKWKNRGSG